MVKLALDKGISKAQVCRDLDTIKTSLYRIIGELKKMNIFQWDSKIAERIRLKLGWSHYAMYCVSFFKGVALTCLVIWLMS